MRRLRCGHGLSPSHESIRATIDGGEQKTAESPPHTRCIQGALARASLVLGGIRCASSFVTDGDSTVAQLIIGEGEHSTGGKRHDLAGQRSSPVDGLRRGPSVPRMASGWRHPRPSCPIHCSLRVRWLDTRANSDRRFRRAGTDGLRFGAIWPFRSRVPEQHACSIRKADQFHHAQPRKAVIVSTTIPSRSALQVRDDRAEKQRQLLRAAVLACGVASSVLYVVATDGVAASMWDGYSHA